MNPSQYRVLVVEDQAFQREYLLQLLRDCGALFLESAADGVEAVRLLQQQSFDLVLSDLLMPELDGVQLIQYLATMERPPHLALLSSGEPRLLSGAREAAQAMGLTVLATITKPALAKSIGRLLESLEIQRGDTPPSSIRASGFTQSQLHHALQHGELQTWFQPKKSLYDGRIVAAEALIRWLHPEMGLLLPASFIGDIVRHDLEEALLWTTLDHTLLAQVAWRSQGHQVQVSVNLPPRLLEDPSLPDRLADFVELREGDPAALCFELTEQSVARTPGSYHAGACRLRMKGFSLALDDFGQGYSSLHYLVSTPFTELKIDQSLVRGSTADEALAVALANTVALGRKLGLEVVAEGVESNEEMELLRRLQCDRIQGFLVSQAVSTHDFSLLL